MPGGGREKEKQSWEGGGGAEKEKEEGWLHPAFTTSRGVLADSLLYILH